jgi:hypothetical protein
VCAPQAKVRRLLVPPACTSLLSLLDCVRAVASCSPGSPKPSSHLLSRAMLLLLILNLASHLRSISSPRENAMSCSPPGDGSGCLPSSVIRRSSDRPSLRLPSTFCVVQHNNAIISKRSPKRQDFATKAQIPNDHGTRKPRH